MIIAIDGPAASGKGTLARRLSAHFDILHLDTGLLYRAVAAYMLEKNIPLDDTATATNVAHMLDLTKLDRDQLSVHAIGDAASRIAAIPSVRDALLDVQRNFAQQAEKGAILDGRDIGTIVLPKADIKLFVDASLETRTTRRLQEMQEQNIEATKSAVHADLVLRDARDRERYDAPLRQADDAILLDTTKMDIETAFHKAVDIIMVTQFSS